MIKRETIDKIFATAQVEDVVGEFVNLKNRGVNKIGLCPFHDEKTPSFTVSPTKNIYKCFGCGRGGNAVDFLMEHESMSYPEALKYLAKLYNIEVLETAYSPEEKEKQSERENLFIINEFASDFYLRQLFDTPEGRNIALSYLRQRGINEDVAKKFKLGYAPSSGDALLMEAEKNNFHKSSLDKLGLLNRNGRDFFFKRLIFSIQNMTGRTVAFGGRVFGKNENGPKYINSPETEIYHKSKILYGLFQAKKAIRKLDECLLVEGYMDVLSLHQFEFENAVAVSGTSLTEDHAQMLKRYSQNITLLFDGDDAGIKATLRSIRILLSKDFNIKVLLFEEGMDPDSYLKDEGKEAFREYLDESKLDFLDFIINHYNKNTENDPVAKSQAIREVVSFLALMEDRIKRSLYMKEATRQLSISEDILIEEVNKEINRIVKNKRIDQIKNIREEHRQIDKVINPPRIHSQKKAKPSAEEDHFLQEKDIIRIMIQFGGIVLEDSDEDVPITRLVLDNIADVIKLWKSDDLRKILDIIILEAEKDHYPSKSFFLNHDDAEIKKMAIDMLMEPFEFSQNWEEMHNLPLQNQKMPDLNFHNDMTQAVTRFKLLKYIQYEKDIQRKINELESSDEMDEAELIWLIEAKMKVQNDRTQITEKLRTVIHL